MVLWLPMSKGNDQVALVAMLGKGVGIGVGSLSYLGGTTLRGAKAAEIVVSAPSNQRYW